jgi:hypothetical protein
LAALIMMTLMMMMAGLALSVGRSTAAAGDDNAAFVGTWQGTWSGDSSGKFEMTITKSPTGKLSGSLSTHPDGGDGYTVEFKSIEIASGKLSVKFEDPGGEQEISLTGSADGKSAKGTYTVRQKGDGAQIDSGSWTAARK